MINWADYPEIARMWSTRGARFACHHRLEKKNVWISYAISIGSAYVILITIIGMIDLHIYNVEQYKLLNALSVFISIVIICFSLIEGGRNFALRAIAMHSCAREISIVYHDAEVHIMAEGAGARVDIKEFSKEYDRIIDKYPYNHDRIDIDHFISENIDEFPKYKSQKSFIISHKIKYFFDVYGYFIIILLIVPAFMVLIGFL
ncbi:SLATT domain-containing protein [Phyllobacterium sp. 22552]|uniref:SLATT domain-containing protein n=1 Tax=Phyllobacterium sp. 22552 TaxID=3453941 RepID=UPI003F86E32A